MVDEIFSLFIESLQEASSLEGGPLRKRMGEIVEELVEYIWNNLSDKYPNVKAKICIGSDSPIKIIDTLGNSIEESVDRHCYINDQLVLAIECKTYLDKCYLQRADSDFNLMKTNHNFQSIIVSLQDGIGKDAYNFFMNRGNVNKVYYLADGKRNSSRDKHISRNTDKIHKEYLKTLINDIERFFIEV